MRSITQFLEKRLKVKVNPDKTKVGSPLRLKFLGFSLGVDHNGAYARPAKQSQQRVKKALKLLTKRNRGISLTRMFEIGTSVAERVNQLINIERKATD